MTGACVAKDRGDGLDLWFTGQERDIFREGLVFVFGLLTELLELGVMADGLVLEDAAGLVDDHSDGHFVLHASGDDQVGEFALWLDVLLEDGLDVGEPLLDDAFDGAGALLDVADDLLATR